MSAPGYSVTRSDGATYPSIAAAAKSNGVAVITVRRSIKYNRPLRNGFSFTAIKPQPTTNRHEERLSDPTICPICGKSTRNVSGFCGICYREVRSLNRKEDAYKAASVVA